MKILVLGNGFDLDHNLPTSYIDFLNFCNYALNIDNQEYFEKLKPTQQAYAEILKTNIGIKYIFITFLTNNYLLNYFNTKVMSHGENWIDFEREIKSIVNEFKSLELEAKNSNQYPYNITPNHKIYQILGDVDLDYIWTEEQFSSLHKRLCRSLNNFSNALEFYISLFINQTPIEGYSPDIVDFDANKVITFNYSETYERIYGGIHIDESIEHIHGVAIGDFDLESNINLESIIHLESNIILGITTHDENLQNRYVEFEKYFQRITKKTGNEYKKWLQQKSNANEIIDVMFFGHSLDSADSDIIQDLICYDNSHVKIYYFNEQSYQQIVANLVEIIGKEKLIEFVSGEKPKVEFIKQRKHCVDNTAGMEITRDIHTLYNLHMLNNNKINELILKIKEKISNEDLSYFYSQKKAISLFQALKYYDLEFATRDNFFAICEQLDFPKNKYGKLDYHKEEDWSYFTPWDEMIPCDKKTSQLIKSINESNIKKSEKSEASRPLMKILTLKSSKEMRDYLIKLFEEENPNKNYWNQLESSFELIYKNEDFEDALKLLENENLPLPIKAKFKHFAKAYNEYEYYTDDLQSVNNYQYEEVD